MSFSYNRCRDCGYPHSGYVTCHDATEQRAIDQRSQTNRQEVPEDTQQSFRVSREEWNAEMAAQRFYQESARSGRNVPEAAQSLRETPKERHAKLNSLSQTSMPVRQGNFFNQADFETPEATVIQGNSFLSTWNQYPVAGQSTAQQLGRGIPAQIPSAEPSRMFSSPFSDPVNQQAERSRLATERDIAVRRNAMSSRDTRPDQMELERIRIRETRRRQEEDAREVQAAVAASIESAKAENEARRMRADFEIAAQLQVEEVSEDDQILTKQTREEENALPWVPAVREHERERRENQDAFDMLGWGDASSYVEPRSNLARSSEMPAREESRSPAVDSLRRMLAEAERERKCDDFKRGIICEAIEGMEEEQVILSIMETCMRKLSFRSLNQVPDMMERRLAGRR